MTAVWWWPFGDGRLIAALWHLPVTLVAAVSQPVLLAGKVHIARRTISKTANRAHSKIISKTANKIASRTNSRTDRRTASRTLNRTASRTASRTVNKTASSSDRIRLMHRPRYLWADTCSAKMIHGQQMATEAVCGIQRVNQPVNQPVNRNMQPLWKFLWKSLWPSLCGLGRPSWEDSRTVNSSP